MKKEDIFVAAQMNRRKVNRLKAEVKHVLLIVFSYSLQSSAYSPESLQQKEAEK